MGDEEWLRKLLSPYGVSLGSTQLGQILAYLSLLARWNQHVNLVSAASGEVWVRRHFAESLYLSCHMSLEGRMVDIGSGGGFPALPLKIAFPGLSMTLLEPTGKKRAFLKEVCRVCELDDVDVRPERIDKFDPDARKFSIATCRAVGHFQELIPRILEFLDEGGRIFLWVTARQELDIVSASGDVAWNEPVRIPGTEHRLIWLGTRKPLQTHKE